MIPIAKPLLGEEEKKAVTAVIDSGMIAEGADVAEFEKAFARYTGTKHAIATSSGTAALHLALLAREVGQGDEVIMPSFSFVATANTVLFCNAKPVFVDIEDKTYNINAKKIEDAITKKTKALVAVHLYGHPAELDAIREIAEDRGISLIEDACQAHGATYHGKKAGSIGDAGCFSFYPTKNMTSGEGGMITTDDDEIAEKTRMLRQHGMRVRYHQDALGFNYRMTNIAAAIGLIQLRKLDTFNRKRIENARHLTEKISDADWLTTPTVRDGCTHVFHQYTIKVGGKSRDRVLEALREKGVGAEIYYPIPIHKQKFYRELGYNISLPTTEECAKRVLSLPIHPALTKHDLEHISETLRSIP